MAYTIESARAAVALGPVLAKCNTCGDVHQLGRGESRFEHAARAAACMRARAGCGVERAFLAYREELLGMFDALQRLYTFTYEPTFEWPQDRLAFWGTVVDAMEPLRIASRLRTHAPKHIWEFTSLVYAKAVESYAHILPFSSSAEWMLMPPSECVDEHIAHVYLEWVCDGCQWGAFEIMSTSLCFPSACAAEAASLCRRIAELRTSVLPGIGACATV